MKKVVATIKVEFEVDAGDDLELENELIKEGLSEHLEGLIADEELMEVAKIKVVDLDEEEDEEEDD